MASYNNKDVAKLNEYNLGALEGYSYAKEGKMLEDILPKIGTVERQNGVKAGFAKFLSEASADTDESMNGEGEGDVDFEEPMDEDFGGPDDFGPESDIEPMGGPEFDSAMEEYDENPTFDSFAKVFKASLGRMKLVDSRLLKMAAFCYVHSAKKIRDAVYIQTGQQGLEYWLNRLIADEFNAWYQYYIVEKFLLGDERPHIQETFKSNADDELNDHAAKLIQRLHDLGYASSWLNAPTSWDEYASAKFVNPNINIDNALLVMVQSEQTAIDAYSEACNVAEACGDRVSLDIFKAILADEQEHIAELKHYIRDKQA